MTPYDPCERCGATTEHSEFGEEEMCRRCGQEFINDCVRENEKQEEEMQQPAPATPDTLFLVTDPEGHAPSFNATLSELRDANGEDLAMDCALLRVGENRVIGGGAAGFWRVTRVE